MKHAISTDDDIADVAEIDPAEGKRFSRKRAKQEHRYERRLAKLKLRCALKQTNEEDIMHNNSLNEDQNNADV